MTCKLQAGWSKVPWTSSIETVTNFIFLLLSETLK